MLGGKEWKHLYSHPFFAFFLFLILLAAVFRWNWQGVSVTAVALALMLPVATFVQTIGPMTNSTALGAVRAEGAAQSSMHSGIVRSFV
jgi:hypothetical protein